MKKNLLIILFFISFIFSNAQMIKDPYLIYSGDPTTMKVMFQTEKPQIYIISYGLTSKYEIGGAQISQLKKGKDENIFEYNFKYLKPKTKYYYKITNKYKTEERIGSFFSAKNKNDRKVYFSVIGKTNLGNGLNENLSKAFLNFTEKEKKFNSIVLHTGNIVKSGNNEKSWRFFFNLKKEKSSKLLANIPLLVTKGANENKKCMLFKNKHLYNKYLNYSFASQNHSYYSYNYGNIKFIILDQFADLEVNSEQIKWLRNELESNLEMPKIVLIHSIKDSSNFQNVLNPMFEKNNVRIVFSADADGYAHRAIGNIHYFSLGKKNISKNAQISAIKTIKSIKGDYFITVKYESKNIVINVLNAELEVIDNFTIITD